MPEKDKNNIENTDNSDNLASQIARDMNNNPSLLSPVSILIDELDDSEPPTGTIINPASGVEVNGVIDITVQATDNDTVHSVIFYVNGTPEGLVYHNPFDPDNSQGNYLFSWNTTSGLEDSENIISATIRDQSFNQTPLSPITIYVNNEPEMDLEPPYLLITSPAAGQTVSGETVIRIYATDNDQISRVAFFINDTVRSIDSTGLDNYYDYSIIIPVYHSAQIIPNLLSRLNKLSSIRP